MIHVIATIEIHEGRREAFLTEFRRLVPRVSAEAGCLENGATIDVGTGLAVQQPLRENVVTVVEKWASVDHLQAHLAASHMQDCRINVKDMLVGLSLIVLEPA